MVGILSLIFGIAGILTSFIYIGIFLCVVGITLGIVGLTDCFSEKNFPLAGLLLSILGSVMSVYVVASDIDSGKLLIAYVGNENINKNPQENENSYIETNSERKEYEEIATSNIDDGSQDAEQFDANIQEDLRDNVADIFEDVIDVEQDNVPTEYQSALQKAISYSEIMYMSKSAIHDQLVSEYGEKFSEDAAQYAMDNIEADWNRNALIKAKEYSDMMCMSKKGIYEQLISEYGERFTEAEAQYAVDNVAADWKYNALRKAETYQKEMNMSLEAIRDQLVSEYGEKFTVEEADYAITNLQ